MSEIGRELRDKSYRCLDQHGPTAEWMRELANRIDAEMAELPRAADGPIHLGDTVFTKDDPGTSWGVRYIELSRDREPSIGIESGGVNTYRPPSCLTHECPDSWSCIADELDEWSEDNRVNGDDDVFRRAREIADRIRRLAEREDANGTD